MKYSKLLKPAKNQDHFFVSTFYNSPLKIAIHLTGNLVTDETKQKIREFMRPRKRVKDLYDLINDPDASDQDNVKLKIGNIDLAAAIQAKLR